MICCTGESFLTSDATHMLGRRPHRTTPLAIDEFAFVAFSVRQHHHAVTIHIVVTPFAFIARSIEKPHYSAARAHVMEKVPFIALPSGPFNDTRAHAGRHSATGLR